MEDKITIVSTFKEGYAIARKEINQKFLYGYVNEELKEVIPFIYDIVFPFINGEAYVKKDENYFFIDKYGNVVENERPKGLNLINNCKGEKEIK